MAHFGGLKSYPFILIISFDKVICVNLRIAHIFSYTVGMSQYEWLKIALFGIKTQCGTNVLSVRALCKNLHIIGGGSGISQNIILSQR